MISYRALTCQDVHQLKEIDRSEHIELIYEMDDDNMIEIKTDHECPDWDDILLREMEERFLYELEQGGMAVGAFVDDTLVGFGVLAHKPRGEQLDQLQVDLMYVTREYRRQGIGTELLNRLGEEAKRRGAKALYISSTETRSAVSFYRSNGSELTKNVDAELFSKEPKDIHMIIQL